jgi:hypothetical protein
MDDMDGMDGDQVKTLSISSMSSISSTIPPAILCLPMLRQALKCLITSDSSFSLACIICSHVTSWPL